VRRLRVSRSPGDGILAAQLAKARTLRSCHHARVTGGSGGPGVDGLRLRFVGVPLSLYAAAEAQWKGLLREYVLRGLGEHTQVYGPVEVDRAGKALDVLSTAVLQLEPEAIQPVPGLHRVDVWVHSDSITADDFALLQGVLDDAIRLSHAGELLVLPPLPEVIALRNWFCDEAMTQSAGSSPSPWQLHGDGPEVQPAQVSWDPGITSELDGAWLMGDEHNRIVAASAEALTMLGWSDQLIGQRLLTVIPPAYREAHLAAFTRSVVTGVGRILGTPLRLPALKADGSEMLITLRLTRHRAHGGHTVFLAVMEPRGPGSSDT
jgi:PAS domain S-box-containing protein